MYTYRLELIGYDPKEGTERRNYTLIVKRKASLNSLLERACKMASFERTGAFFDPKQSKIEAWEPLDVIIEGGSILVETDG